MVHQILNLFVVLLIISPFCSQAQNSVTGKVTGFNHYPLNGVVVTAKKSKQSTSTDAKGYYTITVNEKDKIRFDADGFYSYVIKYDHQDTLNVNLIFENSKKAIEAATESGILSEQELTEALDKYIDENNNFSVYSSIYDLVQSECAGITIDDLNSPPTIFLTGNSAQQPLLLVVDNSISFDIGFISPGEVKNVKVIRGADATMKYGNRGVNGVLEINLKR